MGREPRRGRGIQQPFFNSGIGPGTGRSIRAGPAGAGPPNRLTL